MKKSTIWLLTIIMALTFMGLLYIQITYMSNLKRMRDDQFAEGVKRSLYAVTTRLEQDETRHFLEEDIASMETQFYPRTNRDGTVGFNYKVRTATGGDFDLTFNSNTDRRNLSRSLREVMRGKYLYQKGLLDEVILSIINQSSSRPITERADSADIENYLRSELQNNGLDLPFRWAVVNRAGARMYHSADFAPTPAENREMFVQTLFPNDPKNKMYYLKVYFPTKSKYILESVKFMIPSFAFTLILLLTFVFTIILAFRQKRLTEMKNDFINNMTHEFKTPISTISLAAQMLNDGSVLKSPTMLTHISGVINDETKRLRFQVEKVLQMSMFDRQKATLRLQEVDANILIANIASTFKLKVEKYGGRIEAFLDAEEANVNVDEMHFTNVIYNLLDNAVKYRREEEPLLLKIVTRDISDNRLEISISDNGIGMRKEDLKKIFEKFYRVSTGNRHDVKGFGLGLAYVKKILTDMDGEISVDSTPGEGSCFNIRLKLAGNS
ncbi:MAG: HAMP domain-containing histidine kinase [Duncaniella sp.]|nr:HAMP domain-containing histidine kinase [Duncaniella sp.]